MADCNAVVGAGDVAPTVVIDEDKILVSVPSSDAVVIATPGDEQVTVNVPSSDPVVVNVPSDDPVVINVAAQGPPGPPADLVCAVKPNATLTYTGLALTRIDYADGRYKELTYTSGQLTQVDCVEPGVQTVRKTLGYTAGRLTSVSTTIL